MSGPLDRYHPFRDSLAGGASSGGSSSVDSPPASDSSSRDNDRDDYGGDYEESKFISFFNRLPLAGKLAFLAGVAGASIYAYILLGQVLEPKAKTGFMDRADAVSGRDSNEEEDDWSYHGPDSRKRSKGIVNRVFCGGHQRPAFCD